MGLIDSFAVRPIGRNRKEHEVRIRQASGMPDVLITDVGFGVSQLLPVIIQCYYAPRGSLIIFEQPEIHLHPRVQAALADVFLDATLENDIQILVESHSEHFIRRLQRRVAEQQVNHEQISLYFVNQDQGKSNLTPLIVDGGGQIVNWPRHFFGDELGELAAIALAGQ